MNARESLKSVSHDDVDFIQLVLNLFHETGTTYCVIGGLAVNAYAEPVVSLDLYIVVVSRELDSICAHMRERGLRVETYEHSIKLASAKSDLRIQLQTDERYQTFIPRSTMKPVLGYAMWVAAAEDVLQGKIWAYQT